MLRRARTVNPTTQYYNNNTTKPNKNPSCPCALKHLSKIALLAIDDQIIVNGITTVRTYKRHGIQLMGNMSLMCWALQSFVSATLRYTELPLSDSTVNS